MKLYAFLYKHLRRFLLWLYGISVYGAENEPEGNFLLCANHLSNRDVVVLAAAMKHQIKYLAKAELFKIPLLSSLIRALGAHPVDRRGSDVAAIKRSISLLEAGDVVGIFPQGTRRNGVDPRKTEIKHGIGIIAYRSNVPVLPVCIESRNFKIRPFGKVKVKIGKPILREEFGFEKGSLDEFKSASDLIFSRITDMLGKPEQIARRGEK